MKRVVLIHWDESEAAGRAARLTALGYKVEWEPVTPAALKALRAAPPDAFVIDLSRIPSQGRDLGIVLRKFKETRPVPLVFVDGDPEKVAKIRELLPDATYTSWERIGEDLERAIAQPPAHPTTHDSVFAAYSGTPLARKLGIKAGSTVTLIGASAGFEETIDSLPENVSFRRRLSDDPGLIIWFLKTRKELESRVAAMSERVGKEGLWIAWPKRASNIPSDLTQAIVRKIGLANNLVDYKICSVDETWSALKFASR
jgi:hypothetical protein